jgi:hypothetical protein
VPICSYGTAAPVDDVMQAAQPIFVLPDDQLCGPAAPH